MTKKVTVTVTKLYVHIFEKTFLFIFRNNKIKLYTLIRLWSITRFDYVTKIDLLGLKLNFSATTDSNRLFYRLIDPSLPLSKMVLSMLPTYTLLFLSVSLLTRPDIILYFISFPTVQNLTAILFTECCVS